MEIKQQMHDAPSDMPIADKCEYSYKGKRCDKPTIQNSYFCSEHTNEPGIDLEVYKSVNARLRHYANGLWTRTNFFFLVQAGLFTVFVGILASVINRAERYFILVAFAIGFLGLSQACIWYVATKITNKYLRLWRGQMLKIEKVVDKRRHHSEVEELAITTLTPAQLILWLCLVFVVGWLVLLGVLLWMSFIH